jgi:phenylpropionate dioxygenase-like ring-hydroxylating dioxygenase large terminal subunit
MRRYWQPVCLAEEISELPRRVRILCEDLVVFRDRSGRVGCLEMHCAHRGTSLEYGRIEERGIRCCYHGWLFNTEGKCIEMPCEQPGYAERMDVWQMAYPVHEYGGVVFIYMGPPEKQPLFPMYDIIDTRGRDDVVLRGVRLWDDHSIGFVRDCNWLQAFENVVDAHHLVQLHRESQSDPRVQARHFSLGVTSPGKPVISFEKTSLGVRYKMVRTLPNGNRFERYSEDILPNIFLVSNIHERGNEAKVRDRASEMNWCVPVDNQTVFGISIVAWPAKDGKPIEGWKPGTKPISNVRAHELRNRPYEDKQRCPDDMEAQESQRPIAVHALENLALSDSGIVMLRKSLREAIKAVERGEDPQNIVRDPAANHSIETHAWNTVTVPEPA